MQGIRQLLGKTLTKVERVGDDQIRFHAADGCEFLMDHHQDCCESVYIEDICGDLEDLIGNPVLVAEEVSQDDPNPDDGCGMWTFYKVATVKGWVDIRWYGSSNGYYSVAVDFNLVKSPDLRAA